MKKSAAMSMDPPNDNIDQLCYLTVKQEDMI